MSLFTAEPAGHFQTKADGGIYASTRGLALRTADNKPQFTGSTAGVRQLDYRRMNPWNFTAERRQSPHAEGLTCVRESLFCHRCDNY